MPAHKWTFKSRFRANAYGWKGTSLASKRLKELAHTLHTLGIIITNNKNDRNPRGCIP